MTDLGENHLNEVMNTTRTTANFIREKDIRFHKMPSQKPRKKSNFKRRNIRQNNTEAISKIYETAKKPSLNITYLNLDEQSIDNGSVEDSARGGVEPAGVCSVSSRILMAYGHDSQSLTAKNPSALDA